MAGKGSQGRGRAAWQSESNRYSRLVEVGDDEQVPWTTVERQKRQRRSTGGTFEHTRIHESQYKLSINEFKDLSMDDKLVSLFELLGSQKYLEKRTVKPKSKCSWPKDWVLLTICVCRGHTDWVSYVDP